MRVTAGDGIVGDASGLLVSVSDQFGDEAAFL
jgi:regulator of RNase E activity RraA